MQIKVIKGSNQIGGCITEISSKNTKIIIDFGVDLEDDNVFEIQGLTNKPALYDAVFITHSHKDHIGLVNNIIEEIPVYINKDTLFIYNSLCDFTNDKKITRKTYDIDLKNKTPIKIKDMTITPYIIDHSSYNSCMFLIECEGKKILHTGDFRNHGNTGYRYYQMLKEIKKVDVLIIEGTTLSRNIYESKKEKSLIDDIKKIIKDYNQVYILSSSTNLDRTITFFKSRGNKKYVMHPLSANLIKNLNLNMNIDNKNIFVWLPIKYQKNKKDFNLEFSSKFFPYFCMEVKSSMLNDIKLINQKLNANVKKSVIVYSMWLGYQEQMKNFFENIKNLNIDIKYIHTSGHADIKTLQNIEKVLRPNKTIVIHTTDKYKGQKVFKKYVEINDKELIEI